MALLAFHRAASAIREGSRAASCGTVPVNTFPRETIGSGHRDGRLRSGIGSAHHERIAGLGAGVDPDAFHLQVLVDGALAVFPAHAAILVAAERRHEAHRAIRVDPYRAGLDALRHANRATYVARPHPRTKPKADVIGDAHSILLVL